MSVFITYITKLSRNFLHSDPFEYDKCLAITPFFQEHCPDASLLYRVCLIPAKVMHDAPIHVPPAVIKMTMAVGGYIFAILFEIVGIEIDYRISFKQGLAHLVLGVIHPIEAPLSLIPNTHKIHLLYLDRISKIKNSLAKFLETSNKNVITKNIIISNPETEKALKRTQKEVEKKELALQEEQRKAKEQEELLKRTQQELENTLNTEFIPNEELEEIFKKAHQIANDKINMEDPIRKKLIHKKDSPSLSNNKLAYAPTQFSLTYIEIESDDDTEDFWFEDELSENKTATEEKKEIDLCNNTISPFEEEKRPIEEPPFKKGKVTLQKNSLVTKRPKKEPSSPSNLSQASSLDRRKKYSKDLINRRKKSQLVNS